jgi:hypothetical protein
MAELRLALGTPVIEKTKLAHEVLESLGLIVKSSNQTALQLDNA